jgi:hypothetical protein
MKKYLENSQVVKPNHYNWLPGVECIDVAKHFCFCLGNVLKYVWRAGRKYEDEQNRLEKKLEDLEKAQEYLQQAIADTRNQLTGELLK